MSSAVSKHPRTQITYTDFLQKLTVIQWLKKFLVRLRPGGAQDLRHGGTRVRNISGHKTHKPTA